MASDRIRAGVIGCGGMGRHHVETLAGHEAFELIAGADVNPEAFANLPDGVPRYNDAEEMFASHELDLVSIIVPNFLYEPMVKLSAAHGANVFTEKPFGHSLESAGSMIAALEAAGRRGWVGGQRKYHRHFREARHLVAEMGPDFANVVFTYFWEQAFEDMGWRGDRSKSGGVAVIDSGWHVLDCLEWFLGTPESVFCQLSHLESHPNIDDKAAIQLRYPSGLLANLTISFTLGRNALDLTFGAGRRSLYLSYDALVLYDGWDEVHRSDGDPDEELFFPIYDELAKALGGDESAYVTDVHRAERIMRVVHACYDSARRGAVAHLP